LRCRDGRFPSGSLSVCCHLADDVTLYLQLSSLKQLVHLDIAENRFVSIPICALRMFSLQLLDLSNNRLTDLPQDMDR